MNGLGEVVFLKETDDYNVVEIRQNEDFLDFRKYEFLQLDPVPITKYNQVSKPTFIFHQVQVQSQQKNDDSTFFGENVQEFKVGEMQEDSWSDELPKKKKKLKIKMKDVAEKVDFHSQASPELLKGVGAVNVPETQENGQQQDDWGSW